MLAVVFPGQGAQRPGMGSDLYHDDTFARQVFDQIESAIGQNVATLCFESDEETLRQTQNAQIALYTCSLAAFHALKGAMPELEIGVMAGHSVGEYAALAAAAVISVEDGARLVKRRGQLMASSGAQRPGTMAAVLGLSVDELEKVCQGVEASGICVVANDNCPGQLVMSGDVDAIAMASALAMDRGAKRVIPLNVSGAFHSPLMEESAEQMREALAEVKFQAGNVPVVSNVTAKVETDWQELLVRQLKSPVQWTSSVETMLGMGAQTFVECGSGEVLTGLLRRITKDANGLKVVDPCTLEETVKELGGSREDS